MPNRLDAPSEAGRASKHFAGAQACGRMSPSTRCRGQWHQHEAAPMELRVRQKQLSFHAIAAGAADYSAPKIKNIQIERPRFPATEPAPPGATLS